MNDVYEKSNIAPYWIPLVQSVKASFWNFYTFIKPVNGQ